MTSDSARREPYQSPRTTMASEALVGGERRTFAPRLAPQGAELAEWLELDPSAVLLVAPGGVLLDANHTGRELLEAGGAVSLRGRTVSFSDTQTQQLFLNALAAATSGRVLVRRLILRGDDGAWRQVEIRARVNHREGAFVRLPGDPHAEVDVEALVEAFALSRAEGEVLRRLTEGLLPKEIARALCISTNTVRAHLRMLYLKMNVRGISGVIRQTIRLTR